MHACYTNTHTHTQLSSFSSNEDYPLKPILEHQLTKFEFSDLLQGYIEELYEPSMEWIEKESAK